MVSHDHSSSPMANPNVVNAALSGSVLHDIVNDLDALLIFVELPSRTVSIVRGVGSLGFSLAEVAELHPIDRLVYEDRVRVEALVESMFRDQVPLASIEVVVRDAAGTLRPVRLTFEPVHTPDRLGVLVAVEDLRSEFRAAGTRLRRRELNAIVERAAHRVALASTAQLDAALAVSAEELAATLGADTIAFWTLSSADVIESAPWLWPEAAARVAPSLTGLRVELIADRARASETGIVLLRAAELGESVPTYLHWLRDRRGALICVTRIDHEGNIRILSFHVNEDDPTPHPDEIHAARGAFEIIGNAIDRRAMSETIERNTRWSQAVLESSSDMLAVLDQRSVIRFASASVSDLGYERSDIEGRRSLDLVHPDDLSVASELFASPTSRVLRFRHADGSWRYLECRIRNLLDDPTIHGLLLNARDVTERVMIERTVASYARSQQLLSNVTMRLSAALPGELLDELRCGLVELAVFVGCDRAGLWWTREPGTVDAAMFVGADGSDLLPSGRIRVPLPEALPTFVFERSTDNNSVMFPTMLHDDLPPVAAMLAARFVGPTGSTGMLTLASERDDYEPLEAIQRVVPAFAQIVSTALLRHNAEQRLQHQATIDSVTGLANRAVIRRRLEDDLERTLIDDEGVALLLLDLDDFKLVNDGYGHLAGDDLLRQFGERLRDTCGPGDLVGRLGGDEFVVIRSGLSAAQEIGRLAERITTALHEPFVLDDRRFTVSSSIGISTFQLGDDPVDMSDLLRRADIAMYQAKRLGPGEVARFNDSMGQRARGNAILRTDLELAIKNRELEVWLQPIVDTVTGRRLGAEALARWRHPTLGLMSPDVFVPMAERSGLISALGILVLDKALEALVRLRKELIVDDAFYVSVNVAAPQLRESNFGDVVAAALSAHGVATAQVRLEITESSLVDRALRGSMQELRRSGLQLAIDDFGTGYSSLASLQDLPVDVLKVDRSFVQRIDTDRQAAALVAAVVTMANTLGLETVAEGVETEGQRAALALLGCPASQGYLFARPLEGASWQREPDLTTAAYSLIATGG